MCLLTCRECMALRVLSERSPLAWRALCPGAVRGGRPTRAPGQVHEPGTPGSDMGPLRHQPRATPPDPLLPIAAAAQHARAEGVQTAGEPGHQVGPLEDGGAACTAEALLEPLCSLPALKTVGPELTCGPLVCVLRPCMWPRSCPSMLLRCCCSRRMPQT